MNLLRSRLKPTAIKEKISSLTPLKKIVFSLIALIFCAVLVGGLYFVLTNRNNSTQPLQANEDLFAKLVDSKDKESCTANIDQITQIERQTEIRKERLRISTIAMCYYFMGDYKKSERSFTDLRNFCTTTGDKQCLALANEYISSNQYIIAHPEVQKAPTQPADSDVSPDYIQELKQRSSEDNQ
jgi:hypothetical protein